MKCESHAETLCQYVIKIGKTRIGQIEMNENCMRSVPGEECLVMDLKLRF